MCRFQRDKHEIAPGHFAGRPVGVDVRECEVAIFRVADEAVLADVVIVAVQQEMHVAAGALEPGAVEAAKRTGAEDGVTSLVHALKPSIDRFFLVQAGAMKLLLMLVLAAAVSAAEPMSDAVRDEARWILANTKSTQYSHRTEVDETAGRYNLDCSGLATLILQHMAPAQLRAVRHADGRSRPRAFEFYEAFLVAPTNAVSGWQRVPRLLAARPGDLIAWRKVKIIPGESTGHIVIVDAAPVAETNGTVQVAVIDSTTAPHANDTRRGGTTGVGRGTMWFVVNSAGEPVGTLRKDTGDKPHRPVPIAIGRVVSR